jgi:hypothetical protein
MKRFIFLIIICSLIQSCKKENESISQNNISGKFALSLASTLKSFKTVESDDSAYFDLDTIKSSRSFYFTLSNVGEKDITNINLSTDNNSFSITPSKIQILPGKNSQSSTALSQLISLDILHGVRIDGIGYSGLLPMNDNYCNINIEGQTNNGISDTTINLKSSIKVYAKLMAISLFLGNREYDLTKPNGQGASGPYSNVIRTLNFYPYPSLDPPIVLKNIGNVSILLTITNWNGYTTLVAQDTILNPLDTLVLNLANPAVPPMEGLIKLNSDGTVFDQLKLSLGDDGNAYFGMWCWDEPPNFLLVPNN